jgi:arylsulfatase A-like enzyme
MLVAGGIECARVWPSGGAGAGFLLLLGAQIIAFTAMWVVPVVGVLVGLAAVAPRVLPPATGSRSWGWLLWLPPALWLMLTLGGSVHTWGARNFHRRDLASAVIPLALLGIDVAVVAAAVAGHRLARHWLARVPVRWAWAGLAGGVALIAALHLVRFPDVTRDPLFAVTAQVAVVAVAAGAMLWLPRRLPWQPRWVTSAALGLVVVLLWMLILFGGRIAPLHTPAVVAAVQSRGLIAARIARLATRVGDGDGDGFSRFFGGMDCDDDDPGVHPLARDVPDNGLDEDCFEGDLVSAAVAELRASRLAARRPPQQRVRNVLLITVDALRADAVGFGGAEHPTTPNLDDLAQRGVVFTAAYAHGPSTRRAFPSLLAGRYPSNIHWLDTRSELLYPVSHPDNLFLAEAVRAGGILTAAVMAFSYAKDSRFDQGFNRKKVRPASHYRQEINAHVIVDDALVWLREWARIEPPPRFFLWLHFYEPHFPYARHADSLGTTPLLRYLSEVRYVDRQIGRLLAALGELGLADDTAIVFTGDHGEEFGEHGGTTHGDLYREDLHVPLLVVVPGLPARTVGSVVEHVDVAPTIVELLGLVIPDAFDGDSLVDLLAGGAEDADAIAFAELIPDVKVSRRVLTVIDRSWQLVVDFRLGARELFDLRHDPRAVRNVFADAPAEARRLEARLRRHLALRAGAGRISREGDEDGDEGARRPSASAEDER